MSPSKKIIIRKKKTGQKKPAPPATLAVEPTPEPEEPAEPPAPKPKSTTKKKGKKSGKKGGKKSRKKTGKKSSRKPAAPTPEPDLFKFYCVRCGHKLKVEISAAGRDVKCPSCRSRITIPDPP